MVGRAGFSRMLSEFVLKASLYPVEYKASIMASADEAVRLAPADPEAHRARGLALLETEEFAQAIGEFERAVILRPRHNLMWLELGKARDQGNDLDGAVAAFQEAIRLAPSYPEPRWQLGNLLVRAGRFDEAFAEMRTSLAIDGGKLASAIELAWAVYAGDAKAVEQAIQPQTAQQRLVLARFLAKNGKAVEAIALFRNAGGITEEDRRALYTELITKRKFKEAFEVWVSGEQLLPADQEKYQLGEAFINDGSFEHKINYDGTGFDWILRRAIPGITLELYPKNPRDGGRSLLVKWNGNSNPSSSYLSQLVLVEPKTHYRLQFAARTEDLTTGGAPVFEVADANTDNLSVLSRSELLPQGDNEWQDYKIEFATGDETRAVHVVLRRQPCASQPCPIFGRLWLDAFKLEKSTAETGAVKKGF